MISGVVLSRYVFAFFPKHGGYEFAQQVHILCAYWGFVCMSLHLGFHWSMMLAMARKYLQPSPLWTWSLRLIGWLWAVYGAFAFRRRGVSLYLLLRSHFVFYDYSEPVILFLIDYLSVMVVFVLIGYYASQAIKKINSTHRVMFIGTQVDTISCKGADSVCCPLSCVFSLFLLCGKLVKYLA